MTALPARDRKDFEWPAWLAGLLALAGLCVYLAQAAQFAHTGISSLDEGAYLYKGYLFASGQYAPFEPYGPQTNKAPLAFLIPGAVEEIFGPGLRTGRSLAIAFAALGLAAMWIAARRLGGKWLAAAAVWVFALNPALIKIYSEAVTQSSVFFVLALILALSLGEGRPRWQLVLAGFLAGALIMIRQNMVIVLPLLVWYTWWQHGGKAALLSALAGGSVLLVFHILYWPYILQLWTSWMPGAVQSLFARYDIVLSGEGTWDPSIDLWGRALSFFQGVRFNFVAMTGLLLGLILWPRRQDLWPDEFRAAVFLAVLFLALLGMHSWAAISNDYCVFCFAPYLAFFNVSAVLFLVVIFRRLSREAGGPRVALVIACLLILFAGLGYSLFEEAGDPLLELSVPRVREGRILPGSTTLWEALSNKFALERNPAEKIVSLAAGLGLGLLFLLLVLVIQQVLKPRGVGYAYTLTGAVLGAGLLFAPLLAGSAGHLDCPGTDVIRANEEVGKYLAGHIQSGTAYWEGGLSVAPLLYAPGVNIYLPQINDGYAHRVGGDADQLLRLGFWNDELDAQWLQEADFVIVEGWRYARMKASLPPSTYDELPRSPTQTSCEEGSSLRLFRRK
jgi:4-amino-4-deoxy-L-arabinose transferase-like glycosyltransferase